MRSRFRFLTALAVALCLLAACGGTSDDKSDSASDSGSNPTGESGDEGDIDTDAVLRFAFSSPLQTIDPHNAGSAQFPFVTPVFESLIEMSPEGELIPRLATEWELSDDGLTLDLTIRDGVLFHDGTELDADVVKLNLDRAMEDTTTTAAMLTDVDSVEVVDATHVRLNLNTPGGRLPAVLAERAGLIASAEAIESGDIDANPYGTGPFVLEQVSDALVSYSRFADHWRVDEIALAGVEVHVMSDDSARLNAVRSGQMDLTHIRPQQEAEALSAGLNVVKAPGVSQYGILLNTAQEPFDDPLVRMALSFALDRQAINEALFADGCLPNAQPFPVDTWAYSEELEGEGWGTHDPDRARDLLAQAGLEDGFSFELTTYGVTSYERMAEAVQAQFDEVGIDVSIAVGDAAQLHPDWRSGTLSSWLAIYYPARPDPTVFVTDYMAADGAYNPGGFDNSDATALSLEALTSTDEAQRSAPMIEAVETIYEAGAPLVPICDPVGVVAVRDGVNNAVPPMWGNYDFYRYSVSR